MGKVVAPTNTKECETILKEIEQVLIALFPLAVKREKIKVPAYGLLICYIDLTTDKYSPFAAVLPELHRDKCVANREVGRLWSIAELPTIACLLPKRGKIHGMCNAVYAFLSADWDDEYQAILPFRKMIYRVCLALNKLDWSAYLPVTDDFTVMASDWSAGAHIEDDANASVPAAKKKKLLKRGFFFNPEALPERRIPSGNAIQSIDQQPAEEQVGFWIGQIEALYDDLPCEAKEAKFGVKRIVDRFVKLEAAGANAMLEFIERKAGVPEWMSKEPPKTWWTHGSRTEVLFAVLKGLEVSGLTGDDNERRLWKAFETSIKINQQAEFWGELPTCIAFCIQELFRRDGRRKYDYWVTRDYRDQLVSLAEIRKQRRTVGPK